MQLNKPTPALSPSDGERTPPTFVAPWSLEPQSAARLARGAARIFNLSVSLGIVASRDDFSGARTFLSAATIDVTRAFANSHDSIPSAHAADRNVRAPVWLQPRHAPLYRRMHSARRRWSPRALPFRAPCRLKICATSERFMEKSSVLAKRSLNGGSSSDGRSFSLSLSERERAGVRVCSVGAVTA